MNDLAKMESVKPSKSKLKRGFAKVFHVQKLMGVSHETHKNHSQEFVQNADLSKSDQDSGISANLSHSQLEKRLALESLLARLFAIVSSFKAAYAQLQLAQTPYDTEGIQEADRVIVSELMTLSELKQSFLKKQFDTSPERTMVLAELQELKSLLKTYENTGKKVESQLKLKHSEILFLREKFEVAKKLNQSLQKSLNQSGQLNVPVNLLMSGLHANHFVAFLHQTVKLIRSFNKLMIKEMKLAKWDIDMAADSIQPGIVYHKSDHKCFAFEHFISREMFDSFHLPSFSIPKESSQQKNKKKERDGFFEMFTELKSMKAKEFLSVKPKSSFARFVRAKYLQLVHPDMESSFFGNLHQRNQIMAGELPETSFFLAFLEMSRWVWLLHCLAFAFEPQVSIFQLPEGCMFSEVYMKSVVDEPFFSKDDSLDSEPRVSFTVIPGLKIGRTVIQSEVYLSNS